MKKKIILYFAFTFCISLASVFGREKVGSFIKYEDKKNGYSGWVVAEYLGTTKETDAYREMQDFLGTSYARKYLIVNDCLKLTNEGSFLLWSALEEYNYKKGGHDYEVNN